MLGLGIIIEYQEVFFVFATVKSYHHPQEQTDDSCSFTWLLKTEMLFCINKENLKVGSTVYTNNPHNILCEKVLPFPGHRTESSSYIVYFKWNHIIIIMYLLLLLIWQYLYKMRGTIVFKEKHYRHYTQFSTWVLHT